MADTNPLYDKLQLLYDEMNPAQREEGLGEMLAAILDLNTRMKALESK